MYTYYQLCENYQVNNIWEQNKSIIARRDKKAFLSDQCKEIEENHRMGKTRDLFKKTGDINRTFHARMGTINDRIGKDLTEAEEIKKRWQEYTELTFMTQITTMV